MFSLLFQPAESMNDQTTPVPSVQTSAPFVPRFPDLVTRIGQKGLYILTMVLRAVFTVSLWYKGGGGGGVFVMNSLSGLALCIHSCCWEKVISILLITKDKLWRGNSAHLGWNMVLIKNPNEIMKSVVFAPRLL